MLFGEFANFVAVATAESELCHDCLHSGPVGERVEQSANPRRPPDAGIRRLHFQSAAFPALEGSRSHPGAPTRRLIPSWRHNFPREVNLALRRIHKLIVVSDKPAGSPDAHCHLEDAILRLDDAEVWT